VIIKRRSVLTGIERTRDIPVDPNDIAAWEAGLGNVQDLMPYLNDSDREFILSGITDAEWDGMFSLHLEENDEEEVPAF
jgi:hypothetical protein